MFHLVEAAVPHTGPGSSIIASSSVNSDMPPPALLPYNVTEAGMADMIGSLAQMLAPEGIRADSVAPGPRLDAADPLDRARRAGRGLRRRGSIGRAGQPAELAPVYVLLDSDEASDVSGSRVAVTGGQPIR